MMLMGVNGRAGEVRPDCPVALIENKSDGETDTMKVIPCEHQLPQQREQVTQRWPEESRHVLSDHGPPDPVQLHI